MPTSAKRDVNFNTFDSTWYSVIDPEIVQNIYQDLAFKGPEVPIEVRQNFSIATVYPMQITESDTLMCEVVKIHQGAFEKGKAKCTFDLFQTCHAFDTNIEKLREFILNLPFAIQELI